MASLPPCSLCKAPKKVNEFMQDKKKPILVYSIFFVLLIEFATTIFNWFYVPTITQYDVYCMFYYPLFTQLCFFVIFFSIFLWKERLHFCYRKNAAVFYLSLYYLFGTLAVIFCFSSDFYYKCVNTGMIFISLLIFVQSFYAKNYGD
jgi:hypothetical protein